MQGRGWAFEECSVLMGTEHGVFKGGAGSVGPLRWAWLETPARGGGCACFQGKASQDRDAPPGLFILTSQSLSWVSGALTRPQACVAFSPVRGSTAGCVSGGDGQDLDVWGCGYTCVSSHTRSRGPWWPSRALGVNLKRGGSKSSSLHCLF